MAAFKFGLLGTGGLPSSGPDASGGAGTAPAVPESSPAASSSGVPGQHAGRRLAKQLCRGHGYPKAVRYTQGDGHPEKDGIAEAHSYAEEDSHAAAYAYTAKDKRAARPHP